MRLHWMQGHMHSKVRSDQREHSKQNGQEYVQHLKSLAGVLCSRNHRNSGCISEVYLYHKDGSPDRRFNGNILIPIVAYAAVTLETTTGVNLDFQVSSVSAASGFVELLNPPKSTAQPQARRGSSATDLPELSDTDRAAAILGIRRNPTSDEVNASYRHLAQMYHPDKVAALAPEFQALAEQKMKEINWAYSLLKEAILDSGAYARQTDPIASFALSPPLQSLGLCAHTSHAPPPCSFGLGRFPRPFGPMFPAP